MPRQLTEIKNFIQGTIYNADERDIGVDSNVFSLNVDPISEQGILSAINIDRFVTTIDDTESFFIDPISWSQNENTSITSASPYYNWNRIYLDDISIFDDEQNPKIKFHGTQGKMETLELSYIEPVFETLKQSGKTGALKFTPTVAFTANNDYITIVPDTPITDSGLSNFTTSGFSEGTATIVIAGTISDGGYFNLVTGDGKNIRYEFDTSGSPSTGNQIGGGNTNTCIQINGIATNQTSVAQQVKAAIENASNGHGDRVTVTGAGAVLAINDNIGSLKNYISIGNYVSFSTGTFTGRRGYEILRLEDVLFFNTVNVMYFKRNCFGSPTTTLAAGTEYDVYIGAITVDSTQTKSTMGTCRIDGWGNYSGNNIGGNSHYLNESAATGSYETNGKIATNGSTKLITYDSTDSTITFGTSTNVGNSGVLNFNEGDYITMYQSGTSANNGQRYKILKKTTAPTEYTVFVVDGSSLTSETEASDTVYVEANLIKNHTFFHAITTATQTVGSSANYKCNDWLHQAYKFTASSGGLTVDSTENTYENETSTKVALVTSNGMWDTANLPYESSDASTSYYPFGSGDYYIKLIAEYKKIPNYLITAITTDVNDNVLEFNTAGSTYGDVDNYLAKGDIIAWEGTALDASTEYMKVLSINNNLVTVERGYFGTSLVAVSTGTGNRDWHKCRNHLIEQSIEKEIMKSGQEYNLTLYAQDNDTDGNGFLSISFNGGYINTAGQWTEYSQSQDSGFTSGILKPQEERWIDFRQAAKRNDDVDDGEYGLDNVWRRFDFSFEIPRHMELETDVIFEFSTRGKEASEIRLSMVSLNESTRFYPVTRDGAHASKTSFIDNAGSKTLVMFDDKKGSISAIRNFRTNVNTQQLSEEITVSENASNTFNTTNNSISSTPNNRELHVGFGSGADATAPQWIGYLNHKVFGADYKDVLYQDEDTVHQYDKGEVGTLSKICLAGEHEYLPVSGTNPMTVTHANNSLNIGDNIIVREWLDTNNDWSGNGVWTVVTSDSSEFTCKRVDGDPSGVPSNSKISYRPYFYYGCKTGEPYIYRVWPEARIKSGGSGDTSFGDSDTTYTAGKIERSTPLSLPITSVCTFMLKKVLLVLPH